MNVEITMTALAIFLIVVAFFVGYDIGKKHGHASGWTAGYNTPRSPPPEFVRD
jgi:hypothetical protein